MCNGNLLRCEALNVLVHTYVAIFLHYLGTILNIYIPLGIPDLLVHLYDLKACALEAKLIGTCTY